MVIPPQKDRLLLVAALQWASRLTTIALEMVLPGLGGFWLDQWLGTGVVFLILGVIAGFWLGLSHLLQISRAAAVGKRTLNDKPSQPEKAEYTKHGPGGLDH